MTRSPQPRWASASPAAAQRGLTLLELLLTVVIFSLVIAIFSQAVFQIGLFSRLSSRTTALWQQRWQAGYVLDDYFATLVPPPVNTPPTQGDARSFSAWWVEQSGASAGLPLRVRLELRPLDNRGAASDGAGGGPWGLFVSSATGDEAIVGRWDQRVSLRYQGSTGPAATQWPTALVAAGDPRFELLPRAVWVVNDGGAIIHVWHFGGRVQPVLAVGRDVYMPGGAQTTP